MPSLLFEHITRESDVRKFTGFTSPYAFKMIFEHLRLTAHNMKYWKGAQQTCKESATKTTVMSFYPQIQMVKRGQQRKLSLQQEFLLVMMRLRLGLIADDLLFRFQISSGLCSMIFFTWIKLMSKELRGLISWPEREEVIRNVPDSFRRYYRKCRCIIDCTEMFIETPLSLEVAAKCWSNYKHHHTAKVLVGISPNGSITFLSQTYGGRASDNFMVKECGFLNKLQPGDQVMADRGFKIKELLAFQRCTLAIPPSKQGDLQMSKTDVKCTS